MDVPEKEPGTGKEEPGVVAEIPVESPIKARVKPSKASGKDSDEPLFGTLLIVSFALCLLATVGYFAHAGYRMYQGMQKEKAIPSIDGLPRQAEKETSTLEETKTPAEEKKTETPPSLTAIDKKTLTVKILNGGAAKGSASTYGETLKKAGYTQATFGNSFGSYVGVMIYHATGKEKEAEVLRQDVIKTYPKATVKVAPASDKDATAAPYVVILGQ